MSYRKSKSTFPSTIQQVEDRIRRLEKGSSQGAKWTRTCNSFGCVSLVSPVSDFGDGGPMRRITYEITPIWPGELDFDGVNLCTVTEFFDGTPTTRTCKKLGSGDDTREIVWSNPGVFPFSGSAPSWEPPFDAEIFQIIILCHCPPTGAGGEEFCINGQRYLLPSLTGSVFTDDETRFEFNISDFVPAKQRVRISWNAINEFSQATDVTVIVRYRAGVGTPAVKTCFYSPCDTGQ